MASHHDFMVGTGISVYCFDPQSPSQRSTNENTNGRLRRHFPKTDLSSSPQRLLNEVARSLNNRARATLDFHSPAEKLGELLQGSVEREKFCKTDALVTILRSQPFPELPSLSNVRLCPLLPRSASGSFRSTSRPAVTGLRPEEPPSRDDGGQPADVPL